MQIFKILCAAATLGLALAPLPSRADEPAPPSITVTGQGLVSRPPDLATVSATIVTNDDNAQRALSENNRRFATLSAKLATDGIGAGDIMSASVSSYFNPRPVDRNTPAPGQLYGFIVTRTLEIHVKALTAAGTVIDAATAAGVTQVNGVSYGFRDRRSVERAALSAAVADAAAQAQTIASAARVSIVRVLRISNESAPSGRMMPMAAMMAPAAPEARVPTTISPSDLDVSAAVTITYSIR